MSDRYSQLVNNPLGRIVAKNVGLPQPTSLERYRAGDPVIEGPVLLGGKGRLAEPAAAVLRRVHATTLDSDPGGEDQLKALVFDASGIEKSEDLRALYEFFHPTIRRVARSGRIVVLGTPPAETDDPRAAVAQRALEGFTRSVAKEVRRGATAQLVYASPGAEDQIDSTLCFLLSPKSAYVSGQVVRIERGEGHVPIEWKDPLAGKVALVTGAARGIGAAIAATLARDGAHVVGLDVPQAEADLESAMEGLGGSAIAIDITDAKAPKQIADRLTKDHGGVDVVVHNAGVTRDKTLGRMDEDRWATLLDINLSSAERIDEQLLTRETLHEDGRIVGVSSISGIAGNAGQTNYATSKAGVIGRVEALAPRLTGGRTINAVAPGFIETKMTEAMPFATREAGRRMNSLAQGGLPVDVAETVAWFAQPASSGVNGNVVRVCGQSLIGA